MESMLIFGLIAIVAFALRALLPAPSEPSQVIYVPVAAQEPSMRGGMGCLVPVLIVILVLVVLRLFNGVA